jgi:hypothetical protein
VPALFDPAKVEAPHNRQKVLAGGTEAGLAPLVLINNFS